MAIDDEHSLRLGEVGEKIVRNILTKDGYKVLDSLDPYDNKKDFILIDGEAKTCEVKTQMPWYTENSFTFRKNQYKKIKNVDVAFFVSVPCKDYIESDKYPAWIFKCDNPKKLRCYEKSTSYGSRDMVLVDRDDPAFTKYKQIKDKKALTLLLKYAKARD